MRAAFPLVAALFLSACGMGAKSYIEGNSVHALDGDTLVFMPLFKRVHLEGIAAPGKEQTCTIAGEPWPAGVAAQNHLDDLVEDETVRCEDQKKGAEAVAEAADTAGSLAALATTGPIGWLIGEVGKGRTSSCEVNGKDLSKEMVRHGSAAAKSERYVPIQKEARAANKGIWRCRSLQPPAE